MLYKSFAESISSRLFTTTGYSDPIRSKHNAFPHIFHPFAERKGLSICSTPSTGATVMTEVPRATIRPRVRSFPLRRYGSVESGRRVGGGKRR